MSLSGGLFPHGIMATASLYVVGVCVKRIRHDWKIGMVVWQLLVSSARFGHLYLSDPNRALDRVLNPDGYMGETYVDFGPLWMMPVIGSFGYLTWADFPPSDQISCLARSFGHRSGDRGAFSDGGL